ncbi:MAG: phosphatidylglycerol lysyltransferase domain-containing protein [Nitrospiraceae bacterium]
MDLIQITPLPQVVPSRVCLTCEVCCRFPEPDSFLRPYFTAEEIQRGIARGLDPSHFPATDGSRINVVPNPLGDGYVCAAFDPSTSECRIYDARPLDCQIYPLAVMWSADGREVVLGWDTKCPFLSEGSKGRGAKGNREEGKGQEARGKSEDGGGRGVRGEELEGLSPDSTLEAYAARILDLIEQATMVETFVKNPRLIGRFQDDVVILHPLPRLTERMRHKREWRGARREEDTFLVSAPMLLPLRALTFADRLRLERAAATIETSLSAYAFAPHMIWRKQFRYTRCEIAGHFCLFAEYADGMYMPLPPLGPGPYAEPLAQAFTLMRDRNCGSAVARVENIPDELRAACEALGYRVTPKDPDYLYRATDLAALAGDRYKSQRAAYNQLVRTHHVDYAPYHDRDRDACLELYRRWAAQQEARGLDPVALHMLGDAAFAHRDALTSYLELGLVGRVVRVDGAIGAYTFGYARSQTVWCVLLEVADRSIRGLAQFIFRESCREAAEQGFGFINAMDDSGLERLRWSKHAYHPCRLVSNFIVTEY